MLQRVLAKNSSSRPAKRHRFPPLKESWWEHDASRSLFFLCSENTEKVAFAVKRLVLMLPHADNRIDNICFLFLKRCSQGYLIFITQAGSKLD